MPAETHTHRAPLDRAGVAALVRDLLADLLGLDVTAITDDAHLADLGADDVVLLEWAELLESEVGERTIGFHIDDEDLQELDTVSDAIEDVVSRLV